MDSNETTRDEPGRLLLGALGLLGATTGVVFGRVFQGTHPAVRLAAAGVLAVAISGLLARRRLPLSLLASAAGLLVVLGLFVFPGTTWLGVPTLDTIEALVGAMQRVGERAAIEVAPATPLPSLMAASLIAVWCAATASHHLAVRAGSSTLPLLPAAALLGFASLVTEDPPRPGYVLLFLGTAFAVLFAEAVERSAGRVSRRQERALLSARWARFTGAAAVIAALAVPGVLPGFRDDAMLRLDRSQGRVTVNPIVDIRPSLLQNPIADLFRVRATRPSYWRMTVLDRFDGASWRLSDPTGERGEPIAGSTEFASTPPDALLVDQEFEIDQLATSWLPAASTPVAASVGDDLGPRHDVVTGTLPIDAETSDGFRYRIRSAQSLPPPQRLAAVDPTGMLPGSQELPAGLPFRIREIAQEITSGADSAFEKVLAIQEHLRTFRYDERAPAGHGVDDMVFFLEQSQSGYCEQFAGTMAVLVRTLGLPARVAIGFLPGDQDRSGMYRVTTAQVHAWPEVYFGEYGWLAFEPTPGRTNPSANYLVRLPGSPRPDANLGRGRGRARNSAGAVEQRELFQEAPAGIDGVAVLPQPEEEGGASPFVLPAVLVLLGLLALAAPAKALLRRAELARAREPRRRVLAAYRWVLAVASDLGLGRRPSETIAEYGARMRDVAPPMDELTALAGRALYAPDGVDSAQGDAAVEAARGVLAAMRRDAGPVRSLVGAIRPSR